MDSNGQLTIVPAPGQVPGRAPAPRCCVYTCLYGDRETLPDYDILRQSGLDLIAFVGDPTVTSDVWQIRHVPAPFPQDMPRSSRYPKMMPHRLLPDYDASLYIDCSVELLVPPERLFAAFLLEQTETMALIRHSQHAGLAEEVRAILRQDYDDPLRILEQYRAYAAAGFDAGTPVIWAGMMLRWHHHPEVVAVMEAWFAHVLRYSRRDQLSLPFVLQQTGCQPLLHTLDNHRSNYHRWPVSVRTGRDPWRLAESDDPAEPSPAMAEILDDAEAAALPAQRRIDRLLRALTRAETEWDRCEAELAHMRASRSWRLTAKFRTAWQVALRLVRPAARRAR